MPYVNSSGTRIYYEVEGSGPALLLHHGWGNYAGTWRSSGYVAALQRLFRTIALDARGHGRSDKPHEPESYTMEMRTGDVCAVLDAEGIDRVWYLGYSMGGRTGFAMAQAHSDRLEMLVIGGASPRSPRQYDREQMTRTATMLRQRGVWAVLGPTIAGGDESLRERFELNDAEALAAEREGLLTWDGMDPATIRVPTILYVGGADPVLPLVQEAATRIPRAAIHVLPGLSHLETSRSDAVPALVIAYLQQGALPR